MGDIRVGAASLTEWALKIRDLAEMADTTHVVFNNCYRDYARVNAQEPPGLLRSAA